MNQNTHKIYLLSQVILLLMGYDLIVPVPAHASQRERHSTDSIAYAFMNRYRLMFGKTNHQQINPHIILRSSQMCNKASQILGTNEAFYVYDDTNGGKGFVIVSTDDRMPEILAYSYNEDFHTENMPPSTRYWLECYLDDYQNLESLVSETRTPCVQATDIRPEGVAPLLGELPWGQNNPYNSLCPFSLGGRCVVGCVATAMSQVMWLHKWPMCGRGDINYSTRTHHIQVKMNLAEHPFQWELIKEEYHKGKYTELEAHAVATLMSACGAAVHMDYGSDQSGAFQEDILRALVNNFSYDPDAAFLPREYFTTTDWHTLLITELNAKRAVNYAGQSRTDGGHSFVIDGYERGNDNSNLYYHINWGWDGLCNGYYILPQLLPVEEGEHYTKEGFSEGQQMLINVHPDDEKKETNKMIYTEGLRVMQAILKPGETTILRINKITNLCYRTSKGNLAVQLSNANGQSVVIGKTTFEPIPYLESQSNLQIPFVIPDTLEEGVYSVNVIGIDDEENQIITYSYSSPQIIVSHNTHKEEEQTDTILLCSSEYEIFKQPNADNLLNIKIYELFNYSDYILEGELKLEIATEDGISLMTIGTALQHPAIESQEVDLAPSILSGTIPSTLKNGLYRLYVLFYSSNQVSGNRVRYYNRANPTEVPVEYFLPIEINDEEIIVNGVSFAKQTTDIHSHVVSTTPSNNIYSISGLKLQQFQKGINIATEKNSIKIKTWYR